MQYRGLSIESQDQWGEVYRNNIVFSLSIQTCNLHYLCVNAQVFSLQILMKLLGDAGNNDCSRTECLIVLMLITSIQVSFKVNSVQFDCVHFYSHKKKDFEFRSENSSSERADL